MFSKVPPEAKKRLREINRLTRKMADLAARGKRQEEDARKILAECRILYDDARAADDIPVAARAHLYIGSLLMAMPDAEQGGAA